VVVGAVVTWGWARTLNDLGLVTLSRSWTWRVKSVLPLQKGGRSHGKGDDGMHVDYFQLMILSLDSDGDLGVSVEAWRCLTLRLIMRPAHRLSYISHTPSVPHWRSMAITIYMISAAAKPILAFSSNSAKLRHRFRHAVTFHACLTPAPARPACHHFPERGTVRTRKVPQCSPVRILAFSDHRKFIAFMPPNGLLDREILGRGSLSAPIRRRRSQTLENKLTPWAPPKLFLRPEIS
jgi:hypothetical protein